MANNTRAVLWDVDGTLVDTAELHFEAWRETCRELGRDFTRADFAATFGLRNPEIIRHLFGDRFDDLFEQLDRVEGVVLNLQKELQRLGGLHHRQ